jgi:AcrR family transcriptional regulator
MPRRGIGTQGDRGADGRSQRIAATRPLRRDAIENRRRLLEAAARVFALHGLDSPVEEVAHAAGVGVGTLYRHFPTKEALIEQLVSDFFESVIDAGRQAMQATDGSGFETFVRHTISLQASHRECISRLWQAHARETEIAEFDQLLDILLTRAQTAGRIRNDCTSADVMVVFWAARGIIEAGGQVAPQACHRHLDIIEAGLRPDAAALDHPPLTSGQKASRTRSTACGEREKH